MARQVPNGEAGSVIRLADKQGLEWGNKALECGDGVSPKPLFNRSREQHDGGRVLTVTDTLTHHDGLAWLLLPGAS